MGVRRRAKLSRRNFRRSDRYDGPSLFTDLKARRSSFYSIFFVQQEVGEGWEIYDQT